MVGAHRGDGRRGKRREEEEVGCPVAGSVAGEWPPAGQRRATGCSRHGGVDDVDVFYLRAASAKGHGRTEGRYTGKS